jgi:hypothetical protein
MADGRSDEINSSCNKRRMEANLVLENENGECKKMKYEAMNDFRLVKILAEDARNKTLILHLQSMYTFFCHAWMQPDIRTG